MALSAPLPTAAAARPFGNGLLDRDLRLTVASTDVRYRQKLKAVIVRRERTRSGAKAFAVEMVVLGTPENLSVLAQELGALIGTGLLAAMDEGLSDAVLSSPTTGERVMITIVSQQDYRRVESVAVLEQIHIGSSGEDRGSWVCRMIDPERLDALFAGRVIDIRS